MGNKLSNPWWGCKFKITMVIWQQQSIRSFKISAEPTKTILLKISNAWTMVDAHWVVAIIKPYMKLTRGCLANKTKYTAGRHRVFLIGMIPFLYSPAGLEFPLQPPARTVKKPRQRRTSPSWIEPPPAYSWRSGPPWTDSSTESPPPAWICAPPSHPRQLEL